MKKTFAALCLMSLSALAQADTQGRLIVPEGTPIRLRIMHTLSSAKASEGDYVDFQTLDDLTVGGIVVAPKGSTAIATITDAEPKKRMARGGKLSINIDFLRLPDTTKLALRGVQNLKGGGHTGAMTGGMVATALVVWPAAPFFLFMHGKDVTIPEGQEATVYTAADYEVKSATPATAPSVVAPVVKITGPALTNSDIFKLKDAGLSEDLIVQKIKMSPGNYMVEPDDLAHLKKAGISDAVISAMMTAAAQR